MVEIKHAIDGVVSIHESKLAVDAFKLMRVQGVSAVAVVNDQGIIIGNISAKDLRVCMHYYKLNCINCAYMYPLTASITGNRNSTTFCSM